MFLKLWKTLMFSPQSLQNSNFLGFHHISSISSSTHFSPKRQGTWEATPVAIGCELAALLGRSAFCAVETALRWRCKAWACETRGPTLKAALGPGTGGLGIFSGWFWWWTCSFLFLETYSTWFHGKSNHLLMNGKLIVDITTSNTSPSKGNDESQFLIVAFCLWYTEGN